MTMMQTRDGTRLYTKSWGWGRPVVLIHGWPLNADSWDPIALALANASFRAITYDRRGFGRSDQPSHGYDYNSLTDDLADVLAFHHVGDDAALIGFSMGGGEVVRYMSRYQGAGVSQVALIASVVPGMRADEGNPDGVPAEAFDQMEREITQDRARFLTRFFKQFFGVGLLDRPVSPELIDHAKAMALQAGLLPTLAALRSFANTDFTPDLAAIKVPTLLIHGTADQTVPLKATSQRVSDIVGPSGLIAYDGQPHGLFATRQEELALDLIAFLRNRQVPIVTPPDQLAIDQETAQAMSIQPI